MPPGLRLGGVHLAALPAALRAHTPRPRREVDPQIKPPPLGVEPDVNHLPRLHQTKRPLKQLHIAEDP